MADPSLYAEYGADALPWAAGAAGASITDTGRDTLLALIKAALNAELTAAWTVAVAGSPLAGTAPVQDSFPGEPDADLMLQRKGSFPLLCVYRTGDPWVTDEFSTARVQITSMIGVDWILGPIDAADTKRIIPILQRAAKVLSLTLREGGHPQYLADPLTGLALYVIGDNGAGFKAARPKKTQIGPAKFNAGAAGGTQPTYLAMSAAIEVVELDYLPDTYAGDLDGASISVGTGSDQGIIPDLAVVDTSETQQAPFGIPPPE